MRRPQMEILSTAAAWDKRREVFNRKSEIWSPEWNSEQRWYIFYYQDCLVLWFVFSSDWEGNPNSSNTTCSHIIKDWKRGLNTKTSLGFCFLFIPLVTLCQFVFCFNSGIFGQKLEETVRYERRYGNKLAPMLVEQCVDFIRQWGLQEEGLFRLPGQANLVKELQDAFDCGEKPSFDWWGNKLK